MIHTKSSNQEDDSMFKTKDDAIQAATALFENIGKDCLAHIDMRELEGCETDLCECFFSRLFELGADVNARDKAWNKTALHRSTRFDIAKFLIDHGADVKVVDQNGFTPLHFVSDAETAELIISKGADVNARDDMGCTPLFYVDNLSDANDSLPIDVDYQITNVLINHGADVNARNNNGHTPLLEACHNNNIQVVKALINHGADVNLIMNDQFPLMITQSIDIAQMLIKYGADVNFIESRHGESVLCHNLVYPPTRRLNTQLGNLINIMIEHGLDLQYRNREQKNYIQLIETMPSVIEENRCPTIDLINRFSSLSVELSNDNILPIDFNKHDYIDKNILDKIVIRRNKRTGKYYPGVEYHLYIDNTMVGLWRIEFMNESLISEHGFNTYYYDRSLTNYDHYFGINSYIDLGLSRFLENRDLGKKYESIQNALTKKLVLPACYIEYIYIVKEWRGKGLFKMVNDIVMSEQSQYQQFYLRVETHDIDIPDAQRKLIEKYKHIGFEILADYGECAVMGYKRE